METWSSDVIITLIVSGVTCAFGIALASYEVLAMKGLIPSVNGGSKRWLIVGVVVALLGGLVFGHTLYQASTQTM